jgi:23S rRNA pseudouridine2605 synthase
MAKERLQKVVARAGVSSRRGAEDLIVRGRVRVNGAIVTELGTKVDPRADKVEVDGRRLVAETPVYFVLNKPRGVVSTVSDPEGRSTVRGLVAGVTERVFPVGRLDYHTSGVLLLTNDGEFMDALLHPKRDVPKTYVVKVNGEMKETDRKKWEEGVIVDGEKTRPAEVFVLRREKGKTWLEVTLYEGRNQQLRKMGEATGFPVMRLSRTAFAGITSEGLRPGQFRQLVPAELLELKKTFGVPRRVRSPAAQEDVGRRRPAAQEEVGRRRPAARQSDGQTMSARNPFERRKSVRNGRRRLTAGAPAPTPRKTGG